MTDAAANEKKRRSGARHMLDLFAVLLLVEAALAYAYYYFLPAVTDALFAPLVSFVAWALHTGNAQALTMVTDLYAGIAFEEFFSMLCTAFTALPLFIFAAKCVFARVADALPLSGKRFRGLLTVFALSQVLATFASRFSGDVADLLSPWEPYAGFEAFYGVPMNAADYVLEFFALCVMAPLAEEFVFRGVMAGGLARYGKAFAMAASAFLFGVGHGEPANMVYAFVFGLLLAYVFLETGDIRLPMLLHAANNAVVYAVEYLFPLFLSDETAGVIDALIQVLFFVAALLGVKKLFADKAAEEKPAALGLSVLFTPLVLLYLAFVVLERTSALWSPHVFGGAG